MRQSGMLVHLTSLAGPEGIGTLGAPAREMIDFLHDAGVGVWQMLPVGPTGYGASPYQSPSTFAGNPLLIDLKSLREEGILPAGVAFEAEPASKVDFDAVEKTKAACLQQAFDASIASLKSEVERFADGKPWVWPYAQYQALVEAHGPFHTWPVALRRYPADHNAETARELETLKDRVLYHAFVQYLFDRQWTALRTYAADKKISLFGDIPIYVAPGSCDVWQNPLYFQVDRDLNPQRVAGVPPDYFSADGQLWGNPLYRWLRLWMHGYDWWIDRLRGIGERFDIIRIDHFIGFANYYSIPADAKNARSGKWVKNSGRLFFRKVRQQLPDLTIIAEDLGVTSGRVKKLLTYTSFPGMKVLVFGLDSDESNPHHPANITENSVAYTGTHDNDTVLGWYNRIDRKERQNAQTILGMKPGDDICDTMIRRVMSSPAFLAVIPIQDWLCLDNEARMNYPGTVGGNNWRYRMMPGDLSDALLKRMQRINHEYGRN